MASIETAVSTSISREQLRIFHLTGHGLNEFLPESPLRPAALEQLELPRFEHSYPIYLSVEAPPQPFFRLLRGIVDAHPARFPILRDHLGAIAAAFGEQVGSRECAPLWSIVDRALAAVLLRADLSCLDPQAVQKEFDALRKALPEFGWLIGFGDGALPLLGCAILHSARRPARRAFAEELRHCAQALSELLAVDHLKSPPASPTDRLAAALGARAGAFLDASALAGSLQRRVNSTLPMDAQRRARCESALATIQSAISDGKSAPSIVLFHSGQKPEVPRQFEVEYRQTPDGCDAAMAFCRRQLEENAPVWRALRIARLEVQSAFEASIHREALDALDWTIVHPSELNALPVVLVAETAHQIEQSLASFAQLLQSGLPIQVLIACPDGPGGNLGCLPIAYQEAFALHSSIAATDHLIGGLSQMVGTLRPAAAVVGMSESWITAALLTMARVCPLYRYDPDLGESGSQRLALYSEQPAQFEGLTFAHAAALMPAYQSNFRICPDAAGLDPAELAPQAFPFLLLTDENGERRRAVFTRKLADICAAAQRRWRFLMEMATPKVVKAADPDAEKQARLDGAAQAIHRVISILTNAETHGGRD